jgi:hypothetical protein
MSELQRPMEEDGACSAGCEDGVGITVKEGLEAMNPDGQSCERANGLAG